MATTTLGLEVEPVVRWPRRMTPGTTYLVEADLRLAGDGGWPYEEEEFSFTFLLDGGPGIAVEAIGESTLVLHRFGGTYGPVRFAAVAGEHAGPGALWLSLLTPRGIIARTDELKVTVAPPARQDEPEETSVLPDLTRQVPDRTPARPGAAHFLTVQLQPSGVDDDGYLVTVWAQEQGDHPVPLRMDDQATPLRDIPASLAEPFNEFRGRVNGSEMMIEFILPNRMLDLPVERWTIGAEPLGSVAPVVVRSYERIHSSDAALHDRWRRHWERLHSPQAAVAAFVVQPQFEWHDQSNADLLTLEFTPRSFAPMVDAGLPAIVWRRAGDTRSSEENPFVSTFHSRDLPRLPQLVHEWRRSAQERGQEVGFGLLWDDPGRFPGGFPALRAPL
ncbi:VMAP-C domain-containing protein [Actinomadura napierensis]|uniref:vWA-MoxR associated protein C-terminal domain-containing protein n=1 Tax=Actinomadura napierensis TaxID=267854 RepID=A0ABN3ACD9_9ACTN